MNATADILFFPALTRREAYSVKANGEFYTYSHYRSEIAVDCQHRCVYCDSKADEVGGTEAMQLDHFRPESLPEFEHLVNDPRNQGCPKLEVIKWHRILANDVRLVSRGFLDRAR